MKRLIPCLLLAGCLADARAELAPAPSNSQERMGSSSQRLGGRFNSLGTEFYIRESEAGGNELFFPHGAQVVVSCSVQTFACWTMIDSDDLTSIDNATGVVTDAVDPVANGIGQDGRAGCAPIEASTYRTMVLDLNDFRDASAVGRRQRVCVDAGVALGRPCDDDTHCPVGTCSGVTANRFADIRGAFLAAGEECRFSHE